ncbi:MAG: hypothetical protein LBU32_20295 [Clostridiales bacterium]|nr:hypothetical protein [Clostridiales bacterium]
MKTAKPSQLSADSRILFNRLCLEADATQSLSLSCPRVPLGMRFILRLVELPSFDFKEGAQ